MSLNDQKEEQRSDPFIDQVAIKIREYLCWVDFLNSNSPQYSGTTPLTVKNFNSLLKVEERGFFDDELAVLSSENMQILTADIPRAKISILWEGCPKILPKEKEFKDALADAKYQENFEHLRANLGNYSQSMTSIFGSLIVVGSLSQYFAQFIEPNNNSATKNNAILALINLANRNCLKNFSTTLSFHNGCYYYENTYEYTLTVGKLPSFCDVKVFELIASKKDTKNISHQRLCAFACSDLNFYKLACSLILEKTPINAKAAFYNDYLARLMEDPHSNSLELAIILKNFRKIFEESDQSQLTLSYILQDLQIGINVNSFLDERHILHIKTEATFLSHIIFELRKFLHNIFFTYKNYALQNLVLDLQASLNSKFINDNIIRKLSDRQLTDYLIFFIHDLTALPYIYFLDIMQDVQSQIEYMQKNFPAIENLVKKSETLVIALHKMISQLQGKNKKQLRLDFYSQTQPARKALEELNQQEVSFFNIGYKIHYGKLCEIYNRLENLLINFIANHDSHPLPQFLSNITTRLSTRIEQPPTSSVVSTRNLPDSNVQDDNEYKFFKM